MDRLYEIRDTALEKLHSMVMEKPKKPTGMLGYFDLFERTVNLINRIENAGADEEGNVQTVVLKFKD